MNDLIMKLWKISPQQIYHSIRYPLKDKIEKEISRLKNIPRFQETNFKLYGKNLIVPDSASFLSMYSEIFERGVLNFTSDRNPVIIDCGSNIGISILYFKKLYPDCKIYGFEPDPAQFEILRHNLRQYNFNNIELYQEACSDHDGKEYFLPDGADGGKVIHDIDTEKNAIPVKSTRLRPFLEQEVDFLKMDIEGSETRVLADCDDLLPNVRKMYIEYHSFTGSKQTLHIIMNLLAKHKFRVALQARKYVKPFVEQDPGSANKNRIDMHVYIETVRQV